MVIQRSDRSAFTLVELLVAMVIAGILSSMVAIALRGAQRQAQDTRGKALVDRLNISLLQLYEQDAYAKVNLPSNALSVQSRALSDLMWKRDWLRCSFPDRREDLGQNPARVPYPLSPFAGGGLVYLDDGTRGSGGAASLPVAVPSVSSGVTATSLRAAQLLRFRQRVVLAVNRSQGTSATTFATVVDGNDANGEWTAEHQSAECLYLILSSRTINGMPASDSLRARDIGDTDGDGLSEVLDPWGVPLGFMRWPCGFALTPDWNVVFDDAASTTTREDWAAVHVRKQELQRDALDILNVDPRYTDNATVPPQVNSAAEDPFTLLPMIVSAGSDGEFDLFGLDASGGSLPAIAYATPANDWPNQSGSFVSPNARPETITFPADPTFVDPYMDAFPIDQKLGARIDVNGDGTDQSSDNIFPTLFF